MALIALLLLPIGFGVATGLALSAGLIAVAVAVVLVVGVSAFTLRFFIPLGLFALAFLGSIFVYYLCTHEFESAKLLALAGVFGLWSATIWLIKATQIQMTEARTLWFMLPTLIIFTASYHYSLELEGLFAFILAQITTAIVGGIVSSESKLFSQ